MKTPFIIVCFILLINLLFGQINQQRVWHGFYQTIDITPYRGTKIKFRFAVKTNSSPTESGATALVFTQIQRKNAPAEEYTTYQEAPYWTFATKLFPIPEDAETFTFGGKGFYNGQYMFDEFEISFQTENGTWELIPIRNGNFEEVTKGEGTPKGWNETPNRPKGFKLTVANEGYRQKALLIEGKGIPKRIVPKDWQNSYPLPLNILKNSYIEDSIGFVSYHSKEINKDYQIERLPLEEFGINPYIAHVIESKKGFIWFVTDRELVCYDGIEMRRYLPPQDMKEAFASQDAYYRRSVNIVEDKQGNIWFTSRKGLFEFNPKEEELKLWMHNTDVPKSLLIGDYTTLLKDDFGNLFVGSDNGLNRIIFSENIKDNDTQTYVIEHFTQDVNTNYPSLNKISDNEVIDLYKDPKGNIWVTTSRGVSKITLGKNGAVIDIENYLGPYKPGTYYYDYKIIDFDTIKHKMTVFVTAPEPISGWGTRGDYFALFDLKEQTFEPLLDSEDPFGFRFGIHYTDSSGIIRLATEKSFYLGASTEELQKFEFNMLATPPSCMFPSEQGHVWVGTLNSGLFKISKIREKTLYIPFEKYLDDPDVTTDRLTETLFPRLNTEDSLGNLLIGVENHFYLYQFKRDDKTAKLLPFHGVDNDHYFDLYVGRKSSKDLWSISGNKNLRVNSRSISLDGLEFSNESYRYLRIIGDTPNNQLILKTNAGYFLLNKDNDELQRITFENIAFGISPDTDEKEHIHIDQDQQCWLFDGIDLILYRYDPSGYFTFIKKYPLGISCTHMLDDGKGNLWLATSNGLTRFDKQGGSFDVFEETKELGIFFYYMALDHQGFLWLISPKGNFRFNRKTERLDYFFKLDLQHITSFYTPSFFTFNLTLSTGEIFIPAKNGFYLFDPENIAPNLKTPKLSFTNLWVNNEKIEYGKDSILDSPPSYTKEIKLKHFQNNLSIGFVGLHFLDHTKNQYTYYLENWEDDWNEVGQENIARYANLDPGTYTFHVRAANADGIWNEEGLKLKIHVSPPWYWNTLTKSLYLLLLLAAIYFSYRFQLTRRLQAAEAQRLRELDQVKTRLYINITHEFRTPLTVIQGMSDKIVQQPEKWLTNGTAMIKRNSQHLLQLVNQMLNLSKLESGHLRLNTIQADVVPYVYYLIESFQSYAESKGVGLHILPIHDSILMDYDPNRLMDIIANLLSNAIKFTPAGGNVFVKMEQIESPQSRESAQGILPQKEGLQIFKFTVEDTGVGISEEKLPYIFDLFYQADDSNTRRSEGTGIGLALSKELVKLMDGEISVKSILGKGSEFNVLLPITRQAPLTEHLFTEEHTAKSYSASDRPVQGTTPIISPSDVKAPQLLIIEDNADVVSYLISCLESDYQISVAKDGEQGINKAIEEVPDLIISDIMMPQKDGYEVCDTLKRDHRTSHIPIILLTAKADIDSKVEGLQMGADAYLPKPFHEEELLVRLGKLIELRETLRLKYSSPDHLQSLSVTTTSPSTNIEDSFLKQLHQTIEEHLADSELDVPTLCKLMGMSRTQLYRKLTALTGKSVTIFVREIRLKKASELLIQTDLPVYSIAFDVGFKNANWFSRAFSVQYGISPKQFREQNI